MEPSIPELRNQLDIMRGIISEYDALLREKNEAFRRQEEKYTETFNAMNAQLATERNSADDHLALYRRADDLCGQLRTLDQQNRTRIDKLETNLHRMLEIATENTDILELQAELIAKLQSQAVDDSRSAIIAIFDDVFGG